MLPTSIRTALDLKNAVDAAPRKLRPIGRCVTAMDDFKQEFDEDREDSDEDEDGEDSDEEMDAGEEKSGGASNKELVAELSEFCGNHHVVCRDNWDEKLPEYKLVVKRPGCELDEKVVSDWGSEYAEYPKLIREGLLKRWFDNAAQAGYGDVRAQETKVDVTVRDAREIACDEFEVDSALLDKVAELWGAHFFPARVRVEPYKINLYGPGGHFKPHKDTMQKDLVGTFLTGLGETWDTEDSDDSHGEDEDEDEDEDKEEDEDEDEDEDKDDDENEDENENKDEDENEDGQEGDIDEQGNLVIEGKHYSAEPLRWVAFYPDVVHEVQPVKRGYRAMLAFKIFRLDSDPDEEQPADRLRTAGRAVIEPIVAKLCAPVGILLQRQYGISTTALSGLDGVLLKCARARAAASGGKLEVHLLPVLIHLKGEAYITENDREINVMAKVFPLTDAHVDIILGRNVKQAQETTAWLRDVADVPFFAIETMESCGETWRLQKSDGAAYTGNETLPNLEDSIYLSFAMMMLSPQKRKRAATVSEGKDK